MQTQVKQYSPILLTDQVATNFVHLMIIRRQSPRMGVIEFSPTPFCMPCEETLKVIWYYVMQRLSKAGMYEGNDPKVILLMSLENHIKDLLQNATLQKVCRTNG